MLNTFAYRYPLLIRNAIVWLGLTNMFLLGTGLAQESLAPKTLDGQAGRDLLLDQFRPTSQLKVEQNLLKQAKFPVIDIHSHFFIRLRHQADQRDAYLQVMQRNNIVLSVSLDGTLGERLAEHQQFLSAEPAKQHTAIFANLDWQGTGKANDPASWDCHRADFAHSVCQEMTAAQQAGVLGLKVFKQLGLEYKNPDGSFMQMDDPRWDPIWQHCGKLGWPILVHTADPAAFFLPTDATNERWEELHRHPEWSFYDAKFPRREALLAALIRVVARHPKTNFIAAHIANSAEDLGQASQWLDEHPNLNVEIASRIGELGRQPYTARKFFLKYSDRILFGTDGPWPEPRLQSYWRFLETYDEYFPYSEKNPPPQGMWQIYGIGLPDDVLKKVYHQNTLQLLPGLQKQFDAATATK